MYPDRLEISRALRFETSRHLHGIGNIRRNLLWIKHHDYELGVRLREFDETIGRMGDLLQRGVDPETHGNLIALRVDMATNLLPPKLGELVDRHRASRTLGDPLPEQIEQTYSGIKEKITTGKWKFSTEIIDNPGKIASGLLIEGYGLFLVNFYNSRPLIARSFVLGFEEVLFTDFKNSYMLRDVIGWMKEDADDFSPRVRNELRKTT